MTAHAQLGASSADRWMNCPGSIRLGQDIPDVTTEYAREGTAAHALAERCLTKGLDPDVYLGAELEGVEVTEEMVEAVQVYLAEVRSRNVPGSVLHVETRFDLARLHPPAPMFGTADAVIFEPKTRTLDVLDYKHGRGYAVPAAGNPQLRYYALGAVLALGVRAERIRMTIVQPRAGHPDGIIRTDEITWMELIEFRGTLMRAAQATLAADAPLNVGGWCRFCRALPICSAQKARAVEVAQAEFEVVEADPKGTLPAPAGLSQEQLLRVMAVADDVEAWFRAVRDYVRAELEAGREVPGWKLVAKRATRQWTDPEAVRSWLPVVELGDAAFKTQLKSPAQIEALLKKSKVKLPDELVSKNSSGFNLAPADDPRPAAQPITAVDEFAALPAGN